MENRFIYADNAATTPVSDEVISAVTDCMKNIYGNPSSLYSKGTEAQRVLIDCRERIAKDLGALPSEIYFTSGGSEADNWAIKGAAYAMASKGKKHIITSAFEHHAVLHSCQFLEKQGFEVTYLPVYENGIVHPQDVADAIRPDTALVTIMYANNEIGTIQPIAEIAAICREKGVLFHTDAVQAVGHVDIDVHKQGIDMLSLSGHKFHAPRGIGLLYIRRGINIPNLIDGGAQERGKRAGTENLPAIVGLAVALESAVKDIDGKIQKTAALRDRLVEKVLKIQRSRYNGDAVQRLAGNANFCFEGIEGEGLLLRLNLAGICASSGSACTSGSLDPSHVLLAIGIPKEIAHGSLRISIDENFTEDDIDYMADKITETVEYLRSFSPLWDKITSQ